MRFPDAEYLVLSSRLVPGLDGGFTIATMQRARHMAAAGVDAGRGPWLLTVDPGARAEHDAHRAEFARLGLLADPARMRNLFDEAGGAAPPGVTASTEAAGAAAWLVAAARPGALAAGLPYRTVTDAAGHPVIDLPVIAGDPDWHLSTAPVGVWGPEGIIGVLEGFGGLYRAWLSHVVARLRAAARDPERPVVVVCESRQLGELLVPFAEPGVRIVHTIHTAHTEPPHTPDAPLNPLWARWFGIMDAFDAIVWPTPSQAAAVAARFGARDTFAIVPHPAEPAATRVPAAARTPGRVIMLNRLAPGKRVDHAIRAFAAALAQLPVSAEPGTQAPAARLDIYGDGPARAQLEALIDELGLRGRVHLLGHVPEASTELDDAALLLLTTAFEGQGLVVVEALSHGCPVISYDVGYGPHDMLAGGGGVLVPSGDLEALGVALVRVLGDERLRERLGAEALAAAHRMDIASSMSALAAAVARALAGPTRR